MTSDYVVIMSIYVNMLNKFILQQMDAPAEQIRYKTRLLQDI